MSKKCSDMLKGIAFFTIPFCVFTYKYFKIMGLQISCFYFLLKSFLLIIKSLQNLWNSVLYLIESFFQMSKQ